MDDVGVTAEGWLMKAAEARTKAERMRTSYGRSIMLGEATKYDRLAQEAKARLLEEEKPTEGPQ
jgi:hypothetical protein